MKASCALALLLSIAGGTATGVEAITGPAEFRARPLPDDADEGYLHTVRTRASDWERTIASLREDARATHDPGRRARVEATCDELAVAVRGVRSDARQLATAKGPLAYNLKIRIETAFQGMRKKTGRLVAE